MLNTLKHILITAALCLPTANASIVAVLEILPANDEIDLTIEETRFLTDELRRQAMQLLPKEQTKE